MAQSPGSQGALRAANCRRILAAVESHGALTHADIARLTGLSRASVTNLVRVLESAHAVRVSGEMWAGRRARVVRPAPRNALVAGIDIGRTHVRAAIGRDELEVLGECEIAMPRGTDAREGIALAERLLAQAASDAGCRISSLAAICVGIPGPLDARTGQIGVGSLMPTWVGIPFADVFAEVLGQPVTVVNDANLGALGEYRHGGHGTCASFVYVKLATGVGAGLVLGGRLYTGEIGVAGELGHTTVDVHGPVCRCGNRGCLEIVASVPAMLEVLSARLERALGVDDVLDLARGGDVTCLRVLQDVGRSLGLGLANVCSLLNPGIVVIGGPLSALGGILLEPLRGALHDWGIPLAGSAVVVRQSTFGQRSELVGALSLARSLSATRSRETAG